MSRDGPCGAVTVGRGKGASRGAISTTGFSSAKKKRPQALFLSEQFVGFPPAIGNGGADFMNRLLGRLSALNKSTQRGCYRRWPTDRYCGQY